MFQKSEKNRCIRLHWWMISWCDDLHNKYWNILQLGIAYHLIFIMNKIRNYNYNFCVEKQLWTQKKLCKATILLDFLLASVIVENLSFV
jgi:hypothetical protein